MSVDEGLDIVATKGSHLYNIQVKTANVRKGGHYDFQFNLSSFEKSNQSKTYYVVELRDANSTHFVVLPYVEVQKNIDEGGIYIDRNGIYGSLFTLCDGRLSLGKLSNDVSYFLDNWGVIK